MHSYACVSVSGVFVCMCVFVCVCVYVCVNVFVVASGLSYVSIHTSATKHNELAKPHIVIIITLLILVSNFPPTTSQFNW